MAGLLARAKCPGCARVLAVQPPAGGDGSRDVFPRHDATRDGDRCGHSRSEVAAGEYVSEATQPPLAGIYGRANAVVEAREQGTRQHPVFGADQGAAMAELGRALMERMVALGLPVTGDVERDVAGFERHTRAGALTALGAWAVTASAVMPTLRDAIAGAESDGAGMMAARLPVVTAAALYRLLEGVVAARRRAEGT